MHSDDVDQKVLNSSLRPNVVESYSFSDYLRLVESFSFWEDIIISSTLLSFSLLFILSTTFLSSFLPLNINFFETCLSKCI